MDFNQKYPEFANAVLSHGENMLGPHHEVKFDDGIVQSWRMYPCTVCNTPTTWRFVEPELSMAICSQKCFDESRKG